MLLGRLKGGMAYINVANSMMMGGVSGTAVSDVASPGRVEIQMMKRAGYPAPYAAALTASTAVISPIIPPSVAFIIYGWRPAACRSAGCSWPASCRASSWAWACGSWPGSSRKAGFAPSSTGRGRP